MYRSSKFMHLTERWVEHVLYRSSKFMHIMHRERETERNRDRQRLREKICYLSRKTKGKVVQQLWKTDGSSRCPRGCRPCKQNFYKGGSLNRIWACIHLNIVLTLALIQNHKKVGFRSCISDIWSCLPANASIWMKKQKRALTRIC